MKKPRIAKNTRLLCKLANTHRRVVVKTTTNPNTADTRKKSCIAKYTRLLDKLASSHRRIVTKDIIPTMTELCEINIRRIFKFQ